MTQAGFAPPTFESDREQDTFTARLLLHHFLAAPDLAWLAAFDGLGLSEFQRRALLFVREFGAIDNQAYRQLNEVDTLTASRDLRRLRDAGVLAMRERGVATYYVPGPRLLALVGEVVQERAKTHQFDAETHQLAPETHQFDAETHQLGVEIHQLRPEIHQLRPEIHQFDSEIHQLPALPQALQERLKALGKRPSVSRLAAAIEEVCRVAPHSAEQLASLFGGREPKGFRCHHLAPLVAQRRLVYTIPEMPNHPRQAYLAPKPSDLQRDR